MDLGEDSLQSNEFLDIRDNIFSLEKSGVNDSDDTKFEYEVLNTEQITKDMSDCIVEVNTVAHIPPVITRILLNHLKWDKEKLYEIYYDGDKEKLFNDAKILNPKQYSLVQKRKNNSSSSIHTCQICYNNYPNSKMESSDCGHRFCLDCWEEYLRTKILDEGMIEAIQCAAHQCNMIVEDETIMKLLKDAKIKVKYQYLITNCFVECNRLLKWCPRPECTNAIKVQYIDSQSVTCNCGYTFCFSCSKVWHEPIKCDLFRKWEKKCEDDRDTSNWIASNTKECPKCNAIIEKDGGCNHIICKNPNCRTEFCWTCLGPWEPHGSSWYKCNRYDDEVAKIARDAQQKSRATLQRYLFYYNRYMNHMQSLKLEYKLYEAIKEKLEEIQENMSLIETQFLKLAVDVLCKCRQTLMHTYAFAYYLKRNNQSEIFESNQRDLENATEKLSEYLERDVTNENIKSIKQKVQDKFRYCERRRKVLVEHVYEGYEKMWWEYVE